MAEFNVRADDVNVEQIMHQIRARIREKRGVDYTEEQIQELAKIKLEKFLDPRGVRSDLLEQFQRAAATDVPPTYEFDDQTLIRSGNPLVAFIRRLLQPVLKLFFSPNPLVQALHYQTQINRYLLERAARDVLVYEVMHNLVVEMTRTGIEVKNMKMRVESIAGRLDFNERRARALEAVVQYKPEGRDEHGAPRGGRGFAAGAGQRPAEGAPRGEQGGRGFAPEGAPRGDQGGRASGAEGQGAASPRTDQGPSTVDPMTGGESLRSRRRRRRRGRRSGPGFAGEGRETRDEGRGTEEGRRTADEGRGENALEHGPQGDDQEQRAAEANGPGEAASERTSEADTPTRRLIQIPIRREGCGRRPALRRGHQRRRRTARSLHRGAPGPAHRGRGADDLRPRLRHVAQRVAGGRRADRWRHSEALPGRARA